MKAATTEDGVQKTRRSRAPEGVDSGTQEAGRWSVLKTTVLWRGDREASERAESRDAYLFRTSARSGFAPCSRGWEQQAPRQDFFRRPITWDKSY